MARERFGRDTVEPRKARDETRIWNAGHMISAGEGRKNPGGRENGGRLSSLTRCTCCFWRLSLEVAYSGNRQSPEPW
jgi:hypothetical protein